MTGESWRSGHGSRGILKKFSYGGAPVLAWTLAGLLGLGALAGSVQGQTPPKIYHNNLRFNLPLHLGDTDRSTLKEVQLYVKHGSDNWVCVEKALASKKAFSFKAPEDGEYWFNIVTVDQAGKATPADVTREAPCLIVMVDTTSPKLELALLPGASGSVIHCDIKDANPDLMKLKVEYQMTDLSWRPLTCVSTAADLFPIPDEKNWTGMVRAQTVDKAGNAGAIETNLIPAETTVKQPKTLQELPRETAADTALKPIETDPAPMETRVQKPIPEENPSMPAHQILNSTHAELAYQIDQVGASGVGKVEVWLTADAGKSWKKLCEDKKKKSPVEFDLPGEGVYGLSLVVTNGYGAGDPPPAKGDQPDCWIEVDTTKPVAQLTSVKPLLENKTGALQIAWTASDKNLGSDCVGLSYATSKNGPWMPIAKGLANDGMYKWAVPHDAGGEFFVRLEVTDKAGNMTICESTDKVVLDQSHPRAKVIGVTVKDVRPATPPIGN